MLERGVKRIKLEKTADSATKWIGSTSSLLVHTLLFIISFALPILQIVSFERMLLVLTTLVSLEAIYLSIFIQMSVNKNSQDIEIIQEDVGEIQEDIEEIVEDIDEIQKDVDEIQEDVDEIQEDIEEIEGNPKLETIAKKELETIASLKEKITILENELNRLKK